MLLGLYPNVYTIVAIGVPDAVTPHFHTRWYPVRIGLFTEHDSDAQSSVAATLDALVAHRPHDAFIHRYVGPPNLWSLLSARELLTCAGADGIDLVHIAATGPLAVVALLVASRFGVPVIGSFDPPTPEKPGSFASYVRALVRQSRRLLVTSMAAREAFLRPGISASKVIVWRPGVDASTFAPSKRSDALRERWGVSDARPAVVYAGALSDDRGARRLLSMEVGLRRTRPMHQLVVAGDGPIATKCRLDARTPSFSAWYRERRCRRCSRPPISSSIRAKPSPRIWPYSRRRHRACRWSSWNGKRARARRGSKCGCLPIPRRLHRRDGSARQERRTKESDGGRCSGYAMVQKWSGGLTSVYAEYRAAAEISRVRRDLEPALVPQSRRL